MRLAEGLWALGGVTGTSVVITLPLLVLRRRNATIVAIVVPLAAFASDAVLKLLFHRPRPTGALIPLPQSYSFPSGHAMVAAATYLTIGLLLSDRLVSPRAKTPCCALPALIAIALA